MSHCAPTAARAGHLHLLKWLYLRGELSDSSETWENATKAGHLHILRWAEQKAYTFEYDSLASTAAEYGQLHIIQWIALKGHEFNDYDDIAFLAAINGHLRVLEWIWARVHFPEYIYAWKGGAFGGKIRILEALKDRKVSPPNDVCECAAKHHHAKTLRWLKVNGCCRCGGAFHPAE
ncbi:MAG: hypothetical protein KGL39_35420 [Patescibacteria group bacterium]|nr:hypothetical protein [Patescibacteria group bacterium]